MVNMTVYLFIFSHLNLPYRQGETVNPYPYPYRARACVRPIVSVAVPSPARVWRLGLTIPQTDAS